MAKINKVEYANLGCWNLSTEQWNNLLAAGWREDGRRRLARYGITEEEAIKEFEAITGEEAYDEGCEYCGPPHFFDSFDVDAEDLKV